METAFFVEPIHTDIVLPPVSRDMIPSDRLASVRAATRAGAFGGLNLRPLTPSRTGVATLHAPIPSRTAVKLSSRRGTRQRQTLAAAWGLLGRTPATTKVFFRKGDQINTCCSS